VERGIGRPMPRFLNRSCSAYLRAWLLHSADRHQRFGAGRR
jgi:hypothetical protein